MNCPTCGAAGYTAPREVNNVVSSMVKKATNPGNKLKNLKPTRTRPDTQNHGITRGGRYASD